MARLVLDGHDLTVVLNPVESLMAVRHKVTVPLGEVQSVAVQRKPLSEGSFMADARMGFAAAGAPLQRLATVGPRTRYKDGRAFIVVWRNGESVVIELGANRTGWRLLVVSTSDAHREARLIRIAARLA